MFGINPMELMIILMVALIVVGPKRLPEIGRTIGRAFSELRRVQEEVRDTIRFDLEDDEPEPPTPPVRRPRSPDAPRTPSAAELASAAERTSTTGEPASEAGDTPEVPEAASEATTPAGGEATVEHPPAPAEPEVQGPIAPAVRPDDADSPNGSPLRPARDEAG